ncbi:hypothetical protein ACFE04_017702 [Oxalis oulophora]
MLISTSLDLSKLRKSYTDSWFRREVRGFNPCSSATIRRFNWSSSCRDLCRQLCKCLRVKMWREGLTTPLASLSPATHGTTNVWDTQKYITSFDAKRLAKLPEHRMCLPPVYYQSTKSEAKDWNACHWLWNDIVKYLLDWQGLQKVNLEAKNMGETPLHMASKKGCNKAARRRLAHGVVLAAKANVCDNNAGECYEENNSFEKDDPVVATRLKMPANQLEWR